MMVIPACAYGKVIAQENSDYRNASDKAVISSASTPSEL
jgi:hypothetical protein